MMRVVTCDLYDVISFTAADDDAAIGREPVSIDLLVAAVATDSIAPTLQRRRPALVH